MTEVDEESVQTIRLICPPEPPVGTILKNFHYGVEFHHREDGWWYVNLKPRVDIAGNPDIEGMVMWPDHKPKFKADGSEWEWIIRTHEELEIVEEP